MFIGEKGNEIKFNWRKRNNSIVNQSQMSNTM